MAYTRFPNGPTRLPRPKRSSGRATAASGAVPETTKNVTPPPRSTGQNRAGSTSLGLLVILFLISVCIPVSFNIGSLAMTPVRVMIVLSFVPVLGMFLSGAAGRWRMADILIILYCFWMAAAVFYFHGFDRLEFIGMTLMETLGPYLIARCLIRNEAQYLTLLKILLVLASILAVGGAFEAILGVPLFNTIFGVFGKTYYWTAGLYEKRLGMSRAQTVFEHPILYGLFMSMLLGPIFMSPNKAGKPAGMKRAFPIALGVLFCLSSAPLLSTMVQFALIGWGWVLKSVRARWKLLTILTILGYFVVDAISNRSPFEVFITYLTFNAGTGYWRILTFTYGMENVWANPVFGIGPAGYWVRPSWMQNSSVDNFWLVLALRYGIMAFVLFAAAFAFAMRELIKARPASQQIAQERNGLVFMMIGLFIGLCTVHVWGPTSAMVTFMMGVGAWISESPTATEEAS